MPFLPLSPTKSPTQGPVAPTTPVPDPQVPPKPGTGPISNLKLNPKRSPTQGTRPGQPTSPTRINPLPEALPAAAGGVAEGAGAAVGVGLGKSLLRIVPPALAILEPLVFTPPTAKTPYEEQFDIPEPPQPVEKPVIPFNGGQMYGISYRVILDKFYFGQSHISETVVPGKILGIVNTQYPSQRGSAYFQIFDLRTQRIDGTLVNDTVLSTGEKDGNVTIVSIERLDGYPDTGGDPPPTNQPIYSQPANPVITPQPKAPTSAPPLAPQKQPLPQLQPKPQPSQPLLELQPKLPAPVPQPTLQPQPQPIGQPQPVPIGQPQPLPFAEPAPKLGLNLAPPPTAEPTPAPVPAPAPSPTNNPTKYPTTGFQPLIFKPSEPFKPTILTPNPLQPTTFKPNPTTGNPEPVPTTTPTPNRSLDPEPTPLDKFRNDVNKVLTPLGVTIAGITALLNPVGGKLDQIGNQTSPDAIKDAAAAATCQTMQPGGCSYNALNNAVNNGNNQLLERLNAGLNLGELALLKPIKDGVDLANNKLGPILKGADGISGFLQRAYAATHIDKALNAMNTVILLHNAAMLSRNLGSTLGDVTSQALTVIGIKDAQGAPIDVNKEIGTQVNTFMSNLVGAEVWAGTKTNWHKANNIIASASQIVYTTRSLFDSGKEVIEWIANNTGKIGNALKRFRVVGENAYPHLSENVTHQNAWALKIERFRQGTDSLDDAASSLQGVLGEVQNIQEEYKELQEQKQRFDKAIKDVQPKTFPDNTPVKAAREAAIAASQAPANTANVFRGEGETNA